MMQPKNFIPDNLPLKRSRYNVDLYLGKIIEATNKFTEFRDCLSNSKLKAEFFLLPLLNQEAAASTRIEGTQVTIDEMYEAQSNNKDKDKEIQEALNYSEALDYGESYIKDRKEITKRLIKEMHVILMSNGVRGKNKTPGEFKTQENYIGKLGDKRENADFIPPGPELTDALIDNLLEYINSSVDDDIILIKTAIIHAQFETIHPFLDGNGRIGRVLIPLFLAYKKELEQPVFFLSKTLEKNQFQYYANLNYTRWDNDWDKWISFFQSSISKQCDESIKLIKSIEKLLDDDLTLLKKYHDHHQIEEYIKVVYDFPIFTIKRICEKTNISYQTCRAYTKTLLQNDRIYKGSSKRNTQYYNYRFLESLR